MKKGRENGEQKKKMRRTMAGRHVSKCAVMAAVAVTLAFQPCFAMTAHAYTTTSDYGYPYWDDPYSSSYYYDTEGRKVTNVTRTYDDGTKYTAQYKYDTMGHLVYANINDTNGSSSTSTRNYNGEMLVSESSSSYDADYKREYKSAAQYSNGDRIYLHESVKYSDGTSESEETWYLNGYYPLKVVEVDREGGTSQTDYTYNENGKQLTSSKVVSDGSIMQTEKQYNENGVTIYSKIYTYNASTNTHNTQESRIEGEGASYSTYSVETEMDGNGAEYRVETWGDAQNTTKKVSTNPDGSQITETYSYDADGRETLYTKSDAAGIIAKRETTTTHTGRTTVYSDNEGYTSTSSRVYDSKNGRTIVEDTESNSDGSSSYSKRVYSDDYTTESYITRYKMSDGRETSSERTYASDGSSILKEKSLDGTVTETKKNAEGEETSTVETYPDGTRSETVWERREDGLPASKIKRYSDKSEDKITYEYNDKKDVIGETETRRNGVSAVTQYQYSETGYMNMMTTTFSNGLQFIGTQNKVDQDTTQIVYTYSAGDVSQHILIEKDDDTYVKIIYRDGRTEEFTINFWDDDWYSKIDIVDSYYTNYINMAWDIQPMPDSSIEVAAGAADADEANTGEIAAAGEPGAVEIEVNNEALNNSPKVSEEIEITGPASEIEQAKR